MVPSIGLGTMMLKVAMDPLACAYLCVPACIHASVSACTHAGPRCDEDGVGGDSPFLPTMGHRRLRTAMPTGCGLTTQNQSIYK